MGLQRYKVETVETACREKCVARQPCLVQHIGFKVSPCFLFLHAWATWRTAIVVSPGFRVDLHASSTRRPRAVLDGSTLSGLGCGLSTWRAAEDYPGRTKSSSPSER